MAGRGDVVATARSRRQAAAAAAAAAAGRRQHQTPSLPFDVVLEVAARSDPATLVRCAATCRDVRRRVAGDPTFRGRLRLRRTDRFVLPLLRGYLADKLDFDTLKRDLWLLDTTAADGATRWIKAGGGFGNNLTDLKPLSSRNGLLLIQATNTQSNRTELRVCDPATRRSQILPREPKTFRRHSSEAHHVLLVGDGETGGSSGGIGRPFQVLKARVATSEQYRCSRCLQTQTFSSEHGTWGPYTELRTPDLLGEASYYHAERQHHPLVADGVVHWLCLTNSGSYVLMLRVGTERVTVTTLPTGFPRVKGSNHRMSYLLATDSACGSPVVLVADKEKISMWVQSKHTKRWKKQPQPVIMNEEIPRFNNIAEDLLEERPRTIEVKLVRFSERSVVVLIHVLYWCFFWLDLQSKKIVRCFSDQDLHDATTYCPYEKDFSSWVPKFTSKL